MSSIAIVVPIYKERLRPEEQISLRHLNHFLYEYDRWAIAPTGLPVHLSGFKIQRFESRYFASRAAYSRLLLSREFYEAFEEYSYLLIYQLDCLVFSNCLGSYCELGHDYIGAPFFRYKINPQKGFSRVGNGGLSLRRVEAFLKVLTSTHVPSWKEVFTTPLPDLYKFPMPYRWMKKLRVFREARRGVQWYTKHYSLNEDLFWSDRAKLFYSDFNIAPVEVGLRFAFEAHPRYCYEQNGRQLPFGCHAWAKWDREFWEPFLLRKGTH